MKENIFALSVFEDRSRLYLYKENGECELIYEGDYDTCKFLIGGRDYIIYVG